MIIMCMLTKHVNKIYLGKQLDLHQILVVFHTLLFYRHKRLFLTVIIGHSSQASGETDSPSIMHVLNYLLP